MNCHSLVRRTAGLLVALACLAGTARAEDPAPPKKPAQPAPKQGKQGAPVTITAFGNKLIVTSEDPEALALVQTLVRTLTQSAGESENLEVIHLQYASATDAAKILDEVFNGAKPTVPVNFGRGGFGGRGGFTGFGGRGGSPPGMAAAGAAAASGRTERVRVVADPATNSLLVKASPLDMLTIRSLVEKSIDVGDVDAPAMMHSYVIGPLKYASATEVATLLKDVYREDLAASVTDQRRGGRRRGPQPTADTKRVALSIGVDERTNSLVVACSAGLHEDLRALVESLEVASGAVQQVVRVVSVHGIDPQLVQEAIDAIQGRTTTTTASGRGTGNNGRSGSGSFGRSGSGGFGRFGGFGGFGGRTR
jgi:type II secretory pathway component GspD/PulD (secretin)